MNNQKTSNSFSSKNEPDLFPELRITALKDFAVRWAKMWPVIQRIRLAWHEIHPLTLLDPKHVPSSIKYDLVFDITGDEDTLEAFERVTQHLQVKDGHYEEFMPAEFTRVYLKSPPDDFQKEWHLYPNRIVCVDRFLNYLPKGQELPQYDDKPVWALFDRHVAHEPTDKQTSQPEVTNAKCNEHQTAIESPCIQGPISESKKQERPANFFIRQENGCWRVGFDGKDAIIPSLNGVQYIAYLLEKPKQSISCRDLYQSASGMADVITESEAIGQGLSLGNSTEVVIDNRARKAYRIRYQELKCDLAKADDTAEGEGYLIKKDIEKEMTELLRAMKTRKKLPDTNDVKAQTNVKKRLNKVYEALRKTNMQKLAIHLEDNIRPDGNYGYTYTGTFTWDITIK